MAIFKRYYFLSLRTCTLIFKLFVMIFDLCILTVSLLYNKGLPFIKALNVFGRKEQILNISLKALGFILSHFTGSYFIVTIINLAMMSKVYMAKLSWIITCGLKIMLFTSFLILVSVIAFLTENSYVETLLYIMGLSVIVSFKALIFIITRFTSYFIVTVVILTLLWRTPMGKLSWMIVNWGLKIVLFISFHVLIGVIAYKTEIAYFETLLYTVGISLIVYFRVANLCSRMCIPYQPILLQIFSMALTLSVYLSWMQKGLNR